MPDSFVVPTPEMTIERYAELVGVSQRVIEAWIKRGYLPTVKIGKRRLVNVALRTSQCLEPPIKNQT
jgi:excisionase family DNA binding protein